MRALFLAAALSAASLSVPFAAASAQTAASASSRMASAAKLVEAVNSYDGMVAANMRGWEAGMRQALLIDPTMVKLEAQYPGISRAAIEGARPVGLAYVTKFVRGGLDRKAQIVAESMTEEEIATALAFFESPTGRKLVAQLTRQMSGDVEAYAAEKARQARENGAVKFEQAELQAKLRKAAAAAAESFTAEENIDLMRFHATEAAAKMTQAGAQSDREMLVQVNNPPPDLMMKQSQAAQRAALAFIDSK